MYVYREGMCCMGCVLYWVTGYLEVVCMFIRKDWICLCCIGCCEVVVCRGNVHGA